MLPEGFVKRQFCPEAIDQPTGAPHAFTGRSRSINRGWIFRSSSSVWNRFASRVRCVNAAHASLRAARCFEPARAACLDHLHGLLVAYAREEFERVLLQGQVPCSVEEHVNEMLLVLFDENLNRRAAGLPSRGSPPGRGWSCRALGPRVTSACAASVPM